MFYLLSLKERHMRDDSLVWWGPEGRGYFERLRLAGKYTADEAAKHVRPGETVAVPVGVVMNHAERVVFRASATLAVLKATASRAMD